MKIKRNPKINQKKEGLFQLIQSREMLKLCNEKQGFSLQNSDLNPI